VCVCSCRVVLAGFISPNMTSVLHILVINLNVDYKHFHQQV